MKKKFLLSQLTEFAEISVIFLIVALYVFCGNTQLFTECCIVDRNALYEINTFSNDYDYCLHNNAAAILIEVVGSESDNAEVLQYTVISSSDISLNSAKPLKITYRDIIAMGILGMVAEKKFRKRMLMNK